MLCVCSCKYASVPLFGHTVTPQYCRGLAPGSLLHTHALHMCAGACYCTQPPAHASRHCIHTCHSMPVMCSVVLPLKEQQQKAGAASAQTPPFVPLKFLSTLGPMHGCPTDAEAGCVQISLGLFVGTLGRRRCFLKSKGLSQSTEPSRARAGAVGDGATLLWRQKLGLWRIPVSSVHRMGEEEAAPVLWWTPAEWKGFCRRPLTQCLPHDPRH